MSDSPESNNPPAAPKQRKVSEKRYRVLHSMVDTWPQGTVLTAADLKDLDVQRLLDLKAIKVVTADEEGED